MGLYAEYRKFCPPFLQKAIDRARRGGGPSSPSIVMADPSIGSYSQHQEDLIIDAILGNKSEGFYIDIGANHPKLLSNTKRFYDKGWKGVNIEPNPTLFSLFNSERKNDVNLNIGLGKEVGEMDLYVLEPDTLSSFNRSAVKDLLRSPEVKLVSTVHIKVDTLERICERYASDRPIDFISLDVEGFEKEVIAGGNWQRFRPRLLLMEINQGGEGLIDTMSKLHYRLVYANGLNGIFIDDDIQTN